MRFTRTSKALGIVAIAALALTGCGAGGGSNDGASQSAGDPNKVITAYSNEPQNPLLPANTNEVYGGRVVELLFEGLRQLRPDGKPVNALAESIESPDAQNWTIKVKQGQKFTNGEAITAKTFVDSWNFAANSKNLQNNGFFFESIEGYADVSAVTRVGRRQDDHTRPTAETMSGLVATDDSTITVKLAQPEADWSLRLGYSRLLPAARRPRWRTRRPTAKTRWATARTSSKRRRLGTRPVRSRSSRTRTTAAPAKPRTVA